MKNRPFTILVVDDDEANLKLVTNYLKLYSYDIIIARNATIALQRAEMVKPDLILLDVMLDDLDGFETCRCLKANIHTQNIPIIFMTVLDNLEDKLEGFKAGGVDYLTKPLQEAEMLARVRTHVTLYRLQHQLAEEVAQQTHHLNEEIALRKSYQVEKEKLLTVICQQSDQLARITKMMLNQQRQDVLQLLQIELNDQLLMLHGQIESASTALTNSEQFDPLQVMTQLQQATELIKLMQLALNNLVSNLNQQGLETQTSMVNPLFRLSARELEVMQLLVNGKNVGQIALLLGITDKTVYLHRDKLMSKLGVTNLAELTKLAIKYQLLTP